MPRRPRPSGAPAELATEIADVFSSLDRPAGMADAAPMAHAPSPRDDEQFAIVLQSSPMGGDAGERPTAMATVAPLLVGFVTAKGECDLSGAAEYIRGMVGDAVQADTCRRRVHDCAAVLIGAGVLERVSGQGRASRLTRVRVAAPAPASERPAGEVARRRVMALRRMVRLKALARREGGELPFRLLVVGGEGLTRCSVQRGSVLTIREPRDAESTADIAQRVAFARDELEDAFDELLPRCPDAAAMRALRDAVCGGACG